MYLDGVELKICQGTNVERGGTVKSIISCFSPKFD
jgi:hypothetical protein